MKITFLPHNVTWEGEPGSNLMQIAGEAGVLIEGTCGWAGTCKKCKVIIDGVEELACEKKPDKDLTVTLPDGDPQLKRD